MRERYGSPRAALLHAQLGDASPLAGRIDPTSGCGHSFGNADLDPDRLTGVSRPNGVAEPGQGDLSRPCSPAATPGRALARRPGQERAQAAAWRRCGVGDQKPVGEPEPLDGRLPAAGPVRPTVL
jgi:hypothetical protein